MSMDLVPQSQLESQEAEGCEAGIDSQRDEDDILPCEDVGLQEGHMLAEEIFLKEFPFLKMELKEGIRSLYELADNSNTTHQIFAKTDVVTSSIGIVSGVMGIMGLVLAPATAGGSLMLTTASQGLGLALGATDILTRILKYSCDRTTQTKASRILSTSDQEAWNTKKENMSQVMNMGRAAYDCGGTIKNMKTNIRAFQNAKTHPRLTATAKRLLVTGQVSARRHKKIQKLFDGTVLVMSKNTHLLNTAMAGMGLGLDLASLLSSWKQLKEGARSEYAEKLRAKARELEKKLAELTQCYESLQQQLLQESKVYESSAEEAMENLSLSTARLGEAGADGQESQESMLSPSA